MVRTSNGFGFGPLDVAAIVSMALLLFGTRLAIAL
jgi:hypothetical protein